MNPKHPLFLEELNGIADMELPWDRLKDKTVAVTGAGGMIGSYLMYALDAVSRKRNLNIRLLALCRNPEATRLAGIDRPIFVPYDACKPIGYDFRADFIVHTASNAHPLAFSADPVGTMQANLLGTMHLMEHIRKTGGRLVLCSTGEIYGENPALEGGFDEQSFGAIDPMDPRACYPESKRAAETLCASYVRQYGADALSARLTYTYGPTITDRNSRADAQFLRRALCGEDIVMTGSGVQLRSYCYVADTASALIWLMLKGATGEAYNVANPDCAVTIRTYAETLAALANVRLTFELPPERERAGYSKVTRALLRSDKLEKLGWKARYDLRAGLEHTLKISM